MSFPWYQYSRFVSLIKMGNIWLHSGAEKDQAWWKWLLHDFKRWRYVGNSAFAGAFLGVENKAQGSVHAGEADFLIHLWAEDCCECGAK